MLDNNLYKLDSECTKILKYIFIDSLNLYKKLAPNGWISSDYVYFLHPSPQQQYEENKMIKNNINRLLKKEKKEHHYEISDFKQDKLTALPEFEEFLYVLSLTVYDIFSNNHEVVGSDRKIFDFGSLRGSGLFIADFLNDNFNSLTKSYDYLDFYMGTIWIKSRGNLTPFYEFVFQKLKEFHCDWNYFFPRLFLIDPKKIFNSSEHIDDTNYKPGLAVVKEFELSKEDIQTKKLQEEFDKSFKDEYEEAKYKPLNIIVKAYKSTYGVLPNGHPQKEFE